MADLFISYAREDQEFAQRLAAVLEERGWSVWWDRQLVPGHSFDAVIERELGDAAAVIVIWSTASVASSWVRSEASAAADREVLIPVLAEATTVPLRFRILQGVDLVGWDGSAQDARLERLFVGVRSLAGAPAPPGARLPPPDRTDEVVRREAGGAPPGDPPPTDGGRRRLVAVLAVGILALGGVVALALSRVGNNPGNGTPPSDTESTSTSVAADTTTTTLGADTTTATTASPGTDPRPPSGSQVLAFGSDGAEVRQMQQWLNESGTASRLEPDGRFGAQTEAALRAFEESIGSTVDGRVTVGSDDWLALEVAASEGSGPSAPSGETIIDPAVETAVGTIETCADGWWISIVGSYLSTTAANVRATEAPGSGVLDSASCPSLEAGHFLVVYGPFDSHEAGSDYCLELGLATRDECYVRPIDLDPTFRHYDPDGTFRSE